MEHLTSKDQIRILLLFSLSCLSLFIYFTMPFNIVAVYPMLAALITWVSCDQLLGGITLLILLFGAGGGIPGVLLTGIKFEKSMESHLSKYGVITTATITNKIGRSVIRRLKEHEGFELYYSYKTKAGTIINTWEIVSKLEFLSVSKGDKINVIYSSKNENMVDLLITHESLEEYKEIIQQQLEKNEHPKDSTVGELDSQSSTFEMHSDAELRSIIIKDKLTVNILDLSNGQWKNPMNLKTVNKDSITVLILDNNGLTEMPEEIAQFPNLVYLSLQNNRFKFPSKSIFKLPNLKYLDINGNGQLMFSGGLQTIKEKMPRLKIVRYDYDRQKLLVGKSFEQLEKNGNLPN